MIHPIIGIIHLYALDYPIRAESVDPKRSCDQIHALMMNGVHPTHGPAVKDVRQKRAFHNGCLFARVRIGLFLHMIMLGYPANPQIPIQAASKSHIQDLHPTAYTKRWHSTVERKPRKFQLKSVTIIANR